MAYRPNGPLPAHHFFSAQQPRPATAHHPANVHATRPLIPCVPAHGVSAKTTTWVTPFSKNTHGGGPEAQRRVVQHVPIASRCKPGGEIGGKASSGAPLASSCARATSSNAPCPETSASNAQARTDKTTSQMLAEPHSKAENVPAEYFQERKPTDPFFYPTTVNPLTTVGIRAIEKSVPRGTSGSPVRPFCRLETDDFDGPCFVSAPLQNFVEGEQMELIQQQNDNLSKQVQALEHAKSLAAAQNHQNASQIAARNEQLRREAQLAIARSRELQSDICSPESSKLRSTYVVHDEVTFEPPTSFSAKQRDPSAGLREAARSKMDQRYSLREVAREDGNSNSRASSLWPSEGARALFTSMRDPMVKYDMPAQPLEQNPRLHDGLDFNHDMPTSDYNGGKAFYEMRASQEIHAPQAGSSFFDTRASYDVHVPDRGASGGADYVQSDTMQHNSYDSESPSSQLLIAHQPQEDVNRIGDHMEAYEQIEARGQTQTESSEDPRAVELECALETVALSSKSVLNFKDDLVELNKISRPEPVVKSVTEAALTILGLSGSVKDKPHPTWVSLRKALLDRSFLEKLKSFRLDDVTQPQFQKLRKLLLQTDFDEELIKTHCMPIVPLSIWTRAVGVALSLRNFPGGPEIRPVAHAMGPSMPSTPVYASVCEQPYIVEPDFSTFGPEELKRVLDLTVSRPQVASIRFHGLTDCTDLDLPSIIQLEVGEVLVYPNASSKPPIGFGLNKSATVTMCQCWPPDSDAVLSAEGREKYRKKIQHMTEMKNARFVDYDCHTGIWQFDVDHF